MLHHQEKSRIRGSEWVLIDIQINLGVCMLVWSLNRSHESVRVCVCAYVTGWLQLCTFDDNDCFPCVFCSSSHAGGVFLFLRDLSPICQILSNFRLCLCFISGFVASIVPFTEAFAPITAVHLHKQPQLSFLEAKMMRLCLGSSQNLMVRTELRHVEPCRVWEFKRHNWGDLFGFRQWATGKVRELHKLDIYGHNGGCTERALIGFN